MGMRAERLTGYLVTSASNCALSCGEQIDILHGFVSLGLIASTPAPRLLRPCPSLPQQGAPALLVLETWDRRISVGHSPSIQLFPIVHLRDAIVSERRFVRGPARRRHGAP